MSIHSVDHPQYPLKSYILQGTVNKWSTCSKEQKDDWGKTIIAVFGKHCKDPNPAPCKDACPNGRGCTVWPKTICQDKAGCKGDYKSLFNEFCKKTCGICGGASGGASGGAVKPAVKKKTKSVCKDLCPGTECRITPDILCQRPDYFGGCNGGNSDIFSKFCKKSCKKC